MMVQEEEKGLAGAAPMDRQEGLPSEPGGRPEPLQEKGRRGLWPQSLKGSRSGDGDPGVEASIFSQNREQSHQLRVGSQKEQEDESTKKM